MYFKDDVVEINYDTDNKKKERKLKKRFNDIRFNLKVIIPFVILIIIILIIILFLVTRRNRIVYYIELDGNKNVTLYQGDKYVEEGYNGFDNKGNNLTDVVIVNDEVNYNQIGIYKITYTLNSVVVERTINITERPIGVTYIHLLGNTNVYINLNEEYIEPGYEVIDSMDGNALKKKVKVSNDIDNTKAGVYQVTYSVTNSSGITTYKTRTVIVMDSEISLTLDNNNYTNGDVGINVYINDIYFDYLELPNGNKVRQNKLTYNVSDNGTYKFVTYNKKGGSKEKSITVSNINRTKPTGSCSGYYKNGSSVIKVNANDDVGIQKYVINGTSYTTKDITINKELTTVTVTIYDRAGNSSDISCTLQSRKSVPTGSCSGYYKDGVSHIKITANDEAGIKKYVINDTSYNTNDITINKELQNVTVTIYNNVDTTKDITCSLEDYNIKYKEQFTLLKYDQGYTFNYWLNVPKNAKDNMPLVILLHGDGQINNSEKLKKWFLVDYAAHYTKTPFVMIAPVARTTSWVDDSIPTTLKGLIDKTVKDYKINTNKIYIMGYSRGAIGTWNMVNMYPNFFAAAVPISCCPNGGNSASNFKHTKIKAISGNNGSDENYYNQCMTNFVNNINKQGGTAEKITYPGYKHGEMYKAINKDELFEWLLSQ